MLRGDQLRAGSVAMFGFSQYVGRKNGASSRVSEPLGLFTLVMRHDGSQCVILNIGWLVCQ